MIETSGNEKPLAPLSDTASNLSKPQDLADLSELEILILRLVDAGTYRAYDSDMLGHIRDYRAELFPQPLAWFLNLFGPSITQLHRAVDRLSTLGFLVHTLESQEQAEGHGLVNWIGPAPRQRFYKLTTSGLRQLT